MSKLEMEHERIAKILYSMSLDMDYSDYEEMTETEIQQLVKELKVLEDNQCNALLQALALIASLNEDTEFWYENQTKYLQNEVRYPVNEVRCKNCSMCSLVTKTPTGAALKEHEQYYQCLAGAEATCGEGVEE